MLPAHPGTVVEGPQVLPDGLPRGAAAVFLVPTPKVQRSVLEGRPLPSTANPRLALENRIEKDRLFAERVGSLARAHGFPVVSVDGSTPPAQVLAQVEVFWPAR